MIFRGGRGGGAWGQRGSLELFYMYTFVKGIEQD